MNTQNKIYTIVLIATALLPILWMAWVITSVTPALQQNSDIENRIHRSTTVVPKWKADHTFYLTQTNGSSTVFEVAKFECCGTGGLVTWGGKLVMGYLNTVEATPIGTTTKQQVPEIDTEILIHELFHLVTIQPAVVAKCPALVEPRFQEEMAYNIGYLYAQIRSLDEDGRIRLIK